MSKYKSDVYEEWLVSKSKRGDQRAFQELLSLWQPKLLRYGMTLLGDRDAAKEVLQETLLSISRSIYRLEDPAAFPKWAYQILHRRCMDWIRRETRWREHHEPSEDLEAVAAEQEGSDAIDDIDLLREGLRQLDPPLSALLRLFYLEEFSVSEIAELLQIPKGTVKSRLFYARKKLKEAVLKQDLEKDDERSH